MSFFLNFVQIYIIICVEWITSNAKLIAYDCSNTTEAIASYDLFDVHNCKNSLVVPEPIVQYIQILHHDPYDRIQVRQCKMTTFVLKTGCGDHSHLYAVNNGRQNVNHKVTEKQCNEMHSKEATSFGGKRYRLNMNTTNYFSYIDGSLDSGGNCATNTSMISQVILEVRVRQIWVVVNTKEDKMDFPNSVNVQYNKGNYYEPTYGYSYWNIIKHPQCQRNRYTVLFRGNVNMYDSPSYKRTIFYSIPDGTEFALPMRKQTLLVCSNFRVQHTIYDDMVIIRSDWRTTPYQTGNLSMRATELTAAKPVLYTDRLNEKLQNQRCQIKAIQQQMWYLMAVAEPEEFAYFKMRKFGYTSEKNGEIVRIFKCAKTGVEYRMSEKCYDHIPITKNNDKDAFMTERTHIIKNKAVQVDCLSQFL